MDILSKVTPDTFALLFIALAILWVGWQLGRLATRPKPRFEPSMHLSALTDANVQLLSSPEGQRALVDFMMSEAALESFLQDVSGRIRKQERLNIEELLIVVPEEDKKAGIMKRGWNWLKENRGKLLEKLFDKVNGVVKRMIPGLGGSDDDGSDDE